MAYVRWTDGCGALRPKTRPAEPHFKLNQFTCRVIINMTPLKLPPNLYFKGQL